MRFFNLAQSSNRLRQLAPGILFLLALLLVGFAFFGDESYGHLEQLKAELAKQESENQIVRGYVDGMRTEVAGLQGDERALEKAARNELGMVRSNEVLFVFKDKSGAGK